jgi:hypothetical protein
MMIVFYDQRLAFWRFHGRAVLSKQRSGDPAASDFAVLRAICGLLDGDLLLEQPGNSARTAFEAEKVLLVDPKSQFVTLGSTSKIPRYTKG